MKQLAFLLTVFLQVQGISQYCDSFSLTLEDELELGCIKNSLTALHDQLDRDYLYIANNKGGFSVLDLSDPTNMESVAYLPTADFETLAVSRVVQEGNYLYLALGTSFGSHDQPSGLAIVNVENPTTPYVVDLWSSAEDGGATHVAIRDNKAYLSALGNGLIVLDISDKENISFISQYIPPTEWPEGVGIDQVKARHIILEGDLGYLCYGGGGFRILDISDPTDLNEIGRYSNPAVDGTARAYNNSIKRGDLIYIAADYAGLEIIDVSDIDDITLHGWWNPNGLPFPTPYLTGLRWFTSPWHTNELEIIDECGTIFMSCGRTEVVGIDVSNPADPILCGSYGDSTDAVSSYGMCIYEDRIYVGHICSPIDIPFPADWSGIKSFVYDSDCALDIPEKPEAQIRVYPNPTQGLVYFEGLDIQKAEIYNTQGQQLIIEKNAKQTLNKISLQGLPIGIYILKLTNANGQVLNKKISLT